MTFSFLSANDGYAKINKIWSWWKSIAKMFYFTSFKTNNKIQPKTWNDAEIQAFFSKKLEKLVVFTLEKQKLPILFYFIFPKKWLLIVYRESQVRENMKISVATIPLSFSTCLVLASRCRQEFLQSSARGAESTIQVPLDTCPPSLFPLRLFLFREGLILSFWKPTEQSYDILQTHFLLPSRARHFKVFTL
jgi:hypothetical protein